MLDTPTYLDKLNPEQRQAVMHEGGPLLVIAGAGSGKTNTLAHRVAHLIVNGADPRRILLMTFSRRAASEMQRRVERLVAQVMGAKAGVITDALSWAGTFHGIGARLLARACRADRARPRLLDPRPRGFGRPHQHHPPRDGVLRSQEALPDQGHLPRDLLARRQRARMISTQC